MKMIVKKDENHFMERKSKKNYHYIVDNKNSHKKGKTNNLYMRKIESRI